MLLFVIHILSSKTLHATTQETMHVHLLERYFVIADYKLLQMCGHVYLRMELQHKKVMCLNHNFNPSCLILEKAGAVSLEHLQRQAVFGKSLK